jgi:hypothetical protein
VIDVFEVVHLRLIAHSVLLKAHNPVFDHGTKVGANLEAIVDGAVDFHSEHLKFFPTHADNNEKPKIALDYGFAVRG